MGVEKLRHSTLVLVPVHPISFLFGTQ